MKESTLWGHLKPELRKFGKFQKISDRFTPGIPDVIGVCEGEGIVLELKELSGVRVIRTKFRPGQLDWLRDWNISGGRSWIVSSHNSTVYVHRAEFGVRLENGVSLELLESYCILKFTKTRSNHWFDFVEGLVGLK